MRFISCVCILIFLLSGCAAKPTEPVTENVRQPCPYNSVSFSSRTAPTSAPIRTITSPEIIEQVYEMLDLDNLETTEESGTLGEMMEPFTFSLSGSKKITVSVYMNSVIEVKNDQNGFKQKLSAKETVQDIEPLLMNYHVDVNVGIVMSMFNSTDIKVVKFPTDSTEQETALAVTAEEIADLKKTINTENWSKATDSVFSIDNYKAYSIRWDTWCELYICPSINKILLCDHDLSTLYSVDEEQINEMCATLASMF